MARNNNKKMTFDILKDRPTISIVIPYHDMENGAFFLKRCIDSIMMQKIDPVFYEIILTKRGKMASNTNLAISKARGELIKILFMDDYLAHDDVLRQMWVLQYKSSENWWVTGCEHDAGKGRFNPHYPTWSEDIKRGINTIGSPSVLLFRNKLDDNLLFDEKMSWTLDCDLYARLFQKYGEPVIINRLDVVIGIGNHQTTNILSEEEKTEEVNYLNNKHA